MAQTTIGELVYKITGDSSQLNRSINKSDKQVGSFAKTMSRLAVPLLSIFGGAAVIAGLTKFVNKAAEFEQLNVSFTTFLGSAEKATKVLAELERFSVFTPLTIDQVNQAGKALLAFGITSEKLIPTLKTVGDISSATGKDFNELAVIFGKAKTQGTLFAEDINQLTEAGIPIIKEFAKQLGVSEGQVKKLGSQGKITFNNLERAFQDMTGKGGQFFDLMDKQSKTFAGRLSTLQGNLGLVARSIGEKLLPAAGFFVDVLNNLITSEEKQSVILTENNANLQARFRILKAGNQSERERAITIKAVNKELKELNIEQIDSKTSLEELNRLQKESNDLFIKRIRLEATREIIAEKQKEAAELAKKTIENEILNEKARVSIATRLTGRNKRASQLAVIRRVEENKRSTERIKEINEETVAIQKAANITIDLEVKKTANLRTEVLTREQIRKAELDSINKNTALALQIAGSASTKIFEIISRGLANRIETLDIELQAFQKEQDNELLALNKKLKNGIINQQQFENQKQLLANDTFAKEKEISGKQSELKKEQFAADKAAQVATIFISTSVAIARQFADLPVIPAAISAVAMGVLGAAQIAAVLSQPVPQFEHGTAEVPRDMVAQIHQGEAIIPRTFAEDLRDGNISLGGQNQKMGDVIVKVMTMSGEELDTVIKNRTESGEMLIDARALINT